MAPMTRPTTPSFLSLIGYLTVLFGLLSIGGLGLFLAVHQHVGWSLVVLLVIGSAVRLAEAYAAQVLPRRADNKE